MKRLNFLLVALALAGTAVADDKTTRLQEQLKAQGLYGGPVDGNFRSEVAAALRRYQVRSGLEVTGTFDQATAEALKKEPVPQAVAVAVATPLPTSPPAQIIASPPGPVPSSSSPSPLPAEPPPPSTAADQVRVSQFLKDYLREGQTNNLDAQLRYYDFPVQYFQHGRVPAKFVRQDTAGYVRRWPKRHYLLVEPVKVTRTTPNELKVIFTIAYEVKNRSKTARGRTSNESTLRDDGSALHITSLQERHLQN